MKKTILLSFILLFSFQTFSAVTPTATDNFPATVKTSMPGLPASALSYIANMKIKEIEKLLGRKMKLKEKLAFKLYQVKLKRDARRAGEKANNGTTAMILGIAGIATLFIPYVNILAIPCMILALVFGYSTKKHYPNDTHAKVGVILGWVGLGLVVIALILVIAVLASIGWY